MQKRRENSKKVKNKDKGRQKGIGRASKPAGQKGSPTVCMYIKCSRNIYFIFSIFSGRIGGGPLMSFPF